MRDYYTRSSKTKYYTKEENQRFQRDIREYRLEQLTEANGCETPGRVLLDSSLISRTNIKNANIKIIQCGDYYQIYTFPVIIEKTDKNLERMKDKNYCIQKMSLIEIEESGGEELKDISNIDTDLLLSYDSNYQENILEYVKKNMNKEIVNTKKEIKKIEEKNIRRSKLQLQRIVKSNETEFKTFITLTYAENITDISVANKKFANCMRSIKRKKATFKYICVPEFQKRGAVHYHLLTNLDIKKDCDIIIPQKEFTEKQLEKMTEKQRKKCFDVKYWHKGYSSVFSLKNINVVGYMSKYMTKDIDNRLWGRRRYLYSQNLKTPTVIYLNLNDIEDFRHYVDITNDCNLNYESMYSDLNGELIEFQEYKRKEVFDRKEKICT